MTIAILGGEPNPVRLVTGDAAPVGDAGGSPTLLGVPVVWWVVVVSAAVLLAGVGFLLLTRVHERRDPDGAAARGMARSLGLGRRDLVLLDEIARRTSLGTPLELLLSVKRLERAAERFAQVEGAQAPRRRLFELCRRLEIAVPAALAVAPGPPGESPSEARSNAGPAVRTATKAR